MISFFYNGHRIDIEYSGWTGKEKILYDGRVMSEKRSVLGASHVFQVEEEGEIIQYSVEFSTGMVKPKIRVLRKNYLIFSNDAGLEAPIQTGKTETSSPIKETVIKEIVLVICPSCNHRNNSSMRFCENCGASI